MIEVKNLTKKYGSHVAVDHLSFRVEKGQIYGFLGPNGAGKSTTMNIMTGYLAASDGTVIINGHDIAKEPEEAKKSIGYLPELPPLYVDMTVMEYLKFVAELKKVPKAQRMTQIAEVMEMTQIADMQNRLIKNLSKGYRQRVGLAQAILGYPEVIILDEPMVGLDPKQIIEIRDLIKSLSEKHTVILSSHILSEISAVCDHIMIISHGKLVASDSPEGLQKLMSSSREGISGEGNSGEGGPGEGTPMEIELLVKGEFEAVQEVLNAQEEIASVEKLADTESGCVNLHVVSKGSVDIREKLFYALADAKLPIMRMNPIEKSLEDIFLELTGEASPTGDSEATNSGAENSDPEMTAVEMIEESARTIEESALAAEKTAVEKARKEAE